MKRGRTSWTTKVSALTLDRINTRIDSTADSAESIYIAMNLQQYGIAKKTFRTHVMRRRNDRAERAAPMPGAAVDSPLQLLYSSSLAALQDTLDAKTISPNALPSAVKAIISLHELTLKEDASTRANELHEIKMAEYRKRQEAALQTTASTAGLTSEQVAEIRLKVLGL